MCVLIRTRRVLYQNYSTLDHDLITKAKHYINKKREPLEMFELKRRKAQLISYDFAKYAKY